MAAILDLVNFHRFKELEKNAIRFYLITTMFQMGTNKKITFNKHFARKSIKAYTNCAESDVKQYSHSLVTSSLFAFE